MAFNDLHTSFLGDVIQCENKRANAHSEAEEFVYARNFTARPTDKKDAYFLG